MNTRKTQLDYIQKMYQLSDYEMGKLVQGNYSSMSNLLWDEYLGTVKERAKEIGEGKDLQDIIQLTISLNELRKTDNLRESMKLPDLDKMTNKQLREYLDVLQSFDPGQTFLGPRLLETINLTDWKGIQTVKDLAQKMAETMKIPTEWIMERYQQLAKFKEEGE